MFAAVLLEKLPLAALDLTVKAFREFDALDRAGTAE